MKFIFLTDTHIKGSNPKSRKDNFYETLKMKFNEVGEICDRVGADYILHGGDWFDRPDVSPAVVKDFAQIIMNFKRPVFTVAGNHDIYGHNPGTLGR
ncbi:MAG TPA: metallophosphoesterase, partial [Clostridia bacterium]